MPVTVKKLVAVSTSPLPVGDQITDGPGFRMWNLLREVGRTHSVHVVSLYESFHRGRPEPAPRTTPEGFGFEAPSHRPATVQRRLRELAPDILYLPWQCVAFIGRSNQRIPTLIDYVGPGLLEEFVGRGRTPAPLIDLCLSSFGYGDLYLTTTERERFYVLGLLAASHRLVEPVFDRLDPLVKVVRMTPGPGEAARPARKSPDRLVVLLAGAFLPWYDYSVLADAVDALDPSVAARLTVRVLGGNPRDPPQVERVRSSLARGRNAGCFEFVGLVPFQRRLDFYRTADVALAVGPTSVEDDLSARTRVVDALGVGLPILAPGRDEYSRDVIDGGAGFEYTSAASLTSWFTRLLSEPSLLAAASAQIPPVLRERFNATEAARPVLEFIDHPRLLPRSRDAAATLRRVGLTMRDLSASVRKGRP
jgi:glycosyltransferase involved in cell wall biosynthesis